MKDELKVRVLSRASTCAIWMPCVPVTKTTFGKVMIKLDDAAEKEDRPESHRVQDEEGDVDDAIPNDDVGGRSDATEGGNLASTDEETKSDEEQNKFSIINELVTEPESDGNGIIVEASTVARSFKGILMRINYETVHTLSKSTEEMKTV
ncbi:hypothetical protein CHS0354_001797 [Potamilus streckersoni]|uniref:Uncharacterized protein n=1 Tax=Potamilus streckersoni TaxID=2493646 RepID=A0AAE0S4D1_9BIVA|nr:hypothetical protein CHS0354_001797 [Potamilus streckersoni]